RRMATTKRAPPLGEEEAVSLFAARAADARGGAPVIITDEDAGHARAIVRLLGYNRAGILLAAARADTLSPREIAEALDALDDAREPDPQVRAKLARGEAHRLAGRLPHAVGDLEAVLRESEGDLY